ncbi:MAG: homoserine dehydrogenase [Thermoanaerobaculia bacterium]
MSGPVVLKIGGSVLTQADALPAAALEVYRELRRGHRVVAVVSASPGRTDALARQAERLAPVGPQPVGSGDPEHPADPAGPARRAYLATGEAEAAAALALQLAGDGVPVELVEGHRLGLRVVPPSKAPGGGAGRAPVPALAPVGAPCPVAWDPRAVLAALERAPVVVVPGFVGLDGAGRTALLGRGGSDLTAVVLAHRLGGRCRLLKDVDGWYERDPAAPGPPPRRYRSLSWRDAASRPAPVVQEQAVAYASGVELRVEVGRPGETPGTRLGPRTTRLAAPFQVPPPLRVTLLGLGTVGGGVCRHLDALRERYTLAAVLVRDPRRDRDVPVDPALLTDDPDEALAPPSDVVVELIGGLEAPHRFVGEALRRGRHAVTANKLLLAERGPELERRAGRAGLRLLASGAVGGGVPMLEAARRLAADPGILGFRGVLNGTTNFVLGRAADGRSLEEALAEARRLGLAEADPEADLSGRDAAAKTVLLCRAATGRWPPLGEVAAEPVGPSALAAARSGPGVVRQVARADLDGVRPRLRVGPEVLDPDDPLARVQGEDNALVLRLADGSEAVLRGAGAGRRPTALAVLADLEDLRREIAGDRGQAASRREPAVREAAE